MPEVVELDTDDAGSGPALLFVHGHPFDRTMWAPQVEEFSRSHRVLAPDLRGYGRSPLPAGVTTLEDHARDLAALLDRRGIGSATVCGLSMGGQIAMEFCRLFPGRVRSAVFAATFATPDDAAGQERRRAMAERLLREGMAAYAAEVLPRMMAPASIAALPAVARSVRAMMERTRPEGAASSLRGRARRADLTPALRELRVPCLVVVGTEDAFTTLADAEHMARHLPDCRRVVIDGAGHLPNLERPAEFDAALRSFLDGRAGPPSPA